MKVSKARWESKSGKWYVELTMHDDGACTYEQVGGGGCLGVMPWNKAIEAIEQYKLPYAQPDTNKGVLKRVF